MVGEGRAVRWSTHGWNRDLSWRLIRAIVPRVPPFLRPPIHLVTTLVCFAAMPRERRAARANLERITGRRGAASLRTAFRLFYNFSKFMVAYTDVAGRRLEGASAARPLFDRLLARHRGLVVVTLHLGSWEVGLAHLAACGRPVHVVLRPGEAEGERHARAFRDRAGVRTVPAGESAWSSIDLLLALRRGEVVALQGDRAFGAAVREVPLCGAPMPIPAGPFLLAQAAGAPVLLVAVPFVGHRRARLIAEGPIEVGPGDEALRKAMADFARRVEAIVKRHPDQWFNFFRLWPGPRDADAAPDGRLDGVASSIARLPRS
ncbi:MAG: hypothetical protein ACRD6R_02290 [Candidatus Polarisedimenticolia bacterium]